jgi:hypothetical protein
MGDWRVPALPNKLLTQKDWTDSHEGLENLSPLQYARQNGLEDIPSFALW